MGLAGDWWVQPIMYLAFYSNNSFQLFCRNLNKCQWKKRMKEVARWDWRVTGESNHVFGDREAARRATSRLNAKQVQRLLAAMNGTLLALNYFENINHVTYDPMADMEIDKVADLVAKTDNITLPIKWR